MTSRRRQKIILSLLTGLPALLIAGFLIFHQSSKPENKNFNAISDTSTGIRFNMSKTFMPIAKEELAALNPGFSYGFRADSDPNASCIVSQTPLKGSGASSGDQLRRGVLKEVRKVHPDVKLTNPATASKPVKFGEATGILLELEYRTGQQKIKRIEALALGGTSQVIAYCESLAKDSQRYYDDFTTFFSSLKLDS